MIRQQLLASGFQPSAALSSRLKSVPREREAKIRLGYPGRCPEKPTLNVWVPDDSGSLYGPVGSDPLSNRYREAQHALEVVARHCSCGKCLAAIVHFDTPTLGCVEPVPLTRAGTRRLISGLAVPRDAVGASLLGGSLAKAEALAAQHPDHNVVLTILTDWELFDDNLPDLLFRLASFPGTVYAVALRNPPPEGFLVPAIQTVTITQDSRPGSVVRAMFDSLTLHRPGRQLAVHEIS